MATSFRSRGALPFGFLLDSALTLQKARHGLRDKRLAQRKVANESNSGMAQRDILPIPAVKVGRRGARRQTLAYTIHMDDITAARMRVT